MDLEQERALVRQALKDGESFGLLFDEYYPKIYKFALKRTAHLQAAQDITAEVFFKAYKSLWQFRWRRVSFGAWLYKIATNETSNYFARGKRAPIPVAFLQELEHLSVSPDTPETEFIASEEFLSTQKDSARLYLAVQLLPVKYQEVISLRFFEDKSIKEISEILGKKEGTIKSLISRGIDLLEKHMQPNTAPRVIPSDTSINIPSHEQTGN